MVRSRIEGTEYSRSQNHSQNHSVGRIGEEPAAGPVVTATACPVPWCCFSRIYPGHSYCEGDFLELCVPCESGRRASDWLGLGRLLGATSWLCRDGVSVPSPTCLLPILECPQRSVSWSWATEKYAPQTQEQARAMLESKDALLRLRPPTAG